MSEEQFAIWLQGYLACNVFNWNMQSTLGRSIDTAKIGADVLATARSVVSSAPTEALS